MTTFYIGAAGTVLFLILTLFSFTHARFRTLVSFWRYPAFVLPLIVFAWMFSTRLYIPLMGNGCSYSESQGIVQPEKFSTSKKSGVLMFYIVGFGDCQATIHMNDGKLYLARSLNSIFALVLPSDSGQISSIVVHGRDTITGEKKFVIKPGKLTYIGTISSPKGLALLLPGMAAKTAEYSFEAPTDTHCQLLKDWASANRLVLTSPIEKQLSALEESYTSAARFTGLAFGFLPFRITSLNGQPQSKTPEDVVNTYKKYAFLLK